MRDDVRLPEMRDDVRPTGDPAKTLAGVPDTRGMVAA